MGRHLVTQRAALYNDIFRDCPEEVLEKHPGACFKFALASFGVSDFDAFARQLRWIASRFAHGAPGTQAGRWRGEMHVLLALKEFNDIEAMSFHHREALRLLGGPTSLYVKESTWALGCPSVLFMFHRESGKLAAELSQLRSRLPAYYQLASFHGAGGEHIMEAEALYLAGNYQEASAEARAGLEMAGRHNQLGNVVCALFLEARLALAGGAASALLGGPDHSGLLADIRAVTTESRDGFMVHTADLCEGFVYGTLGLYERIPLWLRRRPEDGSRLYAFARGFFPVDYGRARLLAGASEAVAEETEALLRSGTLGNHTLFSIYAHIYLAAAYKASGRTANAADHLDAALSEALPDNIMIPFAENQDLLGPLTGKVLARSGPGRSAAPYFEELAERYERGRQAVLTEIRTRESVRSLTRREAETLRLIASGISTREAAAKMGVTIHTVKAHLKAAAKKTGGSSRVALLNILSKGASQV